MFGQPVFLDEVLDIPEEKAAVERLLKGESIDAVALAVRKPVWWVNEVAKKSELHKEAIQYRKDLIRETLKDKGPILKEIAGQALEIVRDRLKAIATQPELMAQLSPRDLKEITAIAVNADAMERLEKGRPTAHLAISHTTEDLTITLEKLREEDPVFSYPEIMNGNRQSE